VALTWTVSPTYTTTTMSHPHPIHHPSRRPGHPISCTLSSSTLAERPLAASTDHTHRIPPPRISTTAGNCFPSRTARSLWRLNHWVPASQRTHRVYVAASRMHLHCRMWVAARRTRCRCRGVRAEREGGVRELAVLRVASMHNGDTDTLRVHKEAYVLPPRRTELSRSPMSQRERTPC
jgi:hypothetical protein